MAKRKNKPHKQAKKQNKKFIDRGAMPAIILTIIALLCVTLLAFTESATSEARAKQKQIMEDANKKIIFDDADSFPAEEDKSQIGKYIDAEQTIDISKEDSVIDNVYYAQKDGEPIGIIVATNTAGYSGNLVPMMIGYDMEGNIINLTIDAQSQTAGLGTKIADPEFKNQFISVSAGDNVAFDSSADQTVDSVSGATASSTAVIEGINAANNLVREILGLE